MRVDELYTDFVKSLKLIYDEKEADNIADWVFESLTDIKRLDRITNKKKQLTDSMVVQLNNTLKRLLKHEPVQYVLQETWFYKMKFLVNENVLIPRPETEELVEWVVDEVRSRMYDVRNKKSVNITHRTSDIVNILDIGTGSGCIAIAIKKELCHTEIIAIDVSADALEVAKQNAINQNVKIEFKELDFLEEESWSSLPSFNIIVSNPPYIPAKEKSKLAKNVAEFEPNVALFVANNNPFIFYEKIALFAATHLKEEGKIFVEIHEDYSKEVQQIFTEKRFKAEIKKDVYEKERMIKAWK